MGFHNPKSIWNQVVYPAILTSQPSTQHSPIICFGGLNTCLMIKWEDVTKHKKGSC
jgi:hypothetical protein